MQVSSEYPGDAARGACYLSGRARSEIIDVPDQPGRPERVLITDTYLDHEGRVCVGEITVRHMAHLLGMYHGEQVEAIIAENGALRAEVDAQRGEILALKEQLATAEDAREVIYVGADGESYTTAEAAAAMSKPEPEPPVLVEDQGLNEIHEDTNPPATDEVPAAPSEDAPAAPAEDAPVTDEAPTEPEPVDPEAPTEGLVGEPADASPVESGSTPGDAPEVAVAPTEPPAPEADPAPVATEPAPEVVEPILSDPAGIVVADSGEQPAVEVATDPAAEPQA